MTRMIRSPSTVSKSPGGTTLDAIMTMRARKLFVLVQELATFNRKMDEQVDCFDYGIQMMSLFRSFARLYPFYWRETGHERATAVCIEQLDAIGTTTEGKKIFRGSGLDVATGTGIIVHEIGICKEREVLNLIANPYASILEQQHLSRATARRITNIARCCLDWRLLLEQFISKSDSSELPNVFSSFVLKYIANIVKRDIRAYPLASDINKYALFEGELASGRALPELIENSLVRDLLLDYAREALPAAALSKYLAQHCIIDWEQRREFLQVLQKAHLLYAPISGVDVSSEMLRVARAKNRELFGDAVEEMFINANVLEMSLAADAAIHITHKFKYIVIAQLIHLLPNELKKRVIAKCAELLEDDGKLVIVDEWDQAFSGSSFTHGLRAGASDALSILMTTIAMLFKKLFFQIKKEKMVEIMHSAGFVASGLRASCPVDAEEETQHRLFAHIWIKKKEKNGEDGLLIRPGMLIR